jgi:chromosome partitioning protein
MAKIIVLANQKGGVGKTITTFNLATELARLDKTVLMVDLDPQSSLTHTLNIDAEEQNLATVLGITERGAMEIVDIIRPIRERLDLAPGDILLSRTEVGLVVRPAREYQLKRVLDGIMGRYDFILIDSPPSLGLLVINALIAAEWVIVPTQLDTLALRGLGLFVETLAETQADYSQTAKLMGVLPTMVDLRPVHARDVLQALQSRQDLCVFETTIPRTIRFSEAALKQQPLADYEPENPGAVAFANLAKEVISRVT